MKYLLLLFSALTLFACEKNNSKAVNDPNLYMKASINGKAWATDSVAMIGGTNNIFRGAIGDSSDTRILLCIPDTVAATYNFRINEAISATITSFNVSKSESDWLLTWSTGQEIDLKQFVIEVANVGDTSEPRSWRWAGIDSVLSKGPGNHDYQYLHKATGWTFNKLAYRIKMVDNNNKVEYSAVRLINEAVGAYFAAAGQRERRGFNCNVTITGKYDRYITGTFSFTVRLLNGDLVKVENGEFSSRYK